MEYSYPKKSLWKWILLFVIMGVVVCGAVYYFFFYKKGGYSYVSQNNQIQTASWKTYVDDRLGFEIKYPGNWTEQYSTAPDSLLTFCPSSSDINNGCSDSRWIAWINLYSYSKDPNIRNSLYHYLGKNSSGETYYLSASLEDASNTSIINTMVNSFKFTK